MGVYSFTIGHKNVTHARPAPYSMLFASLLCHSWSPLPGITFPDLAQHWTMGKGNQRYLWTSLTFFRTFTSKHMSLNNFCHWLSRNWSIWVLTVMLFKLFTVTRKSIRHAFWQIEILSLFFTYLQWYLVIEALGCGISRYGCRDLFQVILKDKQQL